MLTIGKLSQLTGVKVPTIRYYEQIGLLSCPERSDGGQRIYEMAASQRLSFIRHARELGFSLDNIREFLTLSDEPDQSCSAVDEIARRQLVEIEKRISQLTALQTELHRMLDQCTRQTIRTCRILEVLGDHTLCANEHYYTSDAKRINEITHF